MATGLPKGGSCLLNEVPAVQVEPVASDGHVREPGEVWVHGEVAHGREIEGGLVSGAGWQFGEVEVEQVEVAGASCSWGRVLSEHFLLLAQSGWGAPMSSCVQNKLPVVALPRELGQLYHPVLLASLQTKVLSVQEEKALDDGQWGHVSQHTPLPQKGLLLPGDDQRR